jgi:hypothetical protein
MRALLLLAWLLSACDSPKEAGPAAPPRPPRSPAEPESPPPERIAFVRDGNLWTIRPDGTDARAVTRIDHLAAAHPSWSPDGRRLAFSGSIDPAFQLTPRNLFTVRADGTELSQITPMPRAGLRLDDAPKGMVRGRAFRMMDGQNLPAPGLRVTAYGTHAEAQTGPDGAFQIFLPAGGGWVKLSGTIEDRLYTSWRFTAASEGGVSNLGDFMVPAGGDGEPARPVFSADGKTIVYLERHTLVHRTALGGPVALKTIAMDGSHPVTLAEPTPAAIVAGPLVEGQTVWLKTSDGRILRLDLDTHAISLAIDAGTGVPDSLALAPDGATLATFRLGPSGLPAIVLVRKGTPETLVTLAAGDGVPHAIDFSADGRDLVLDRWTGGGSDLYRLTIATGEWRRLTSDGRSSDPVWWHGR